MFLNICIYIFKTKSNIEQFFFTVYGLEKKLFCCLKKAELEGLSMCTLPTAGAAKGHINEINNRQQQHFVFHAYLSRNN